MTIWDKSESGRGDLHPIDKKDPVAARTLGGGQVVPSSINGRAVAAIADDTSAGMTYIFGNPSQIGGFLEQSFAYGATITQFGLPGDGISTNFFGTEAGIIASTNPLSGVLQVFIDGVLTYGRIPIVAVGIGAGVMMSDTDNSIPGSAAIFFQGVALPTGFPSSGYILVDSEVMQFSSITGPNALGLYTINIGIGGRAQFGTSAAPHNFDASIYIWAKDFSLHTTTDYAMRRMVWFNPFLSPGQHTITMLAQQDTTNGTCTVEFDGFVFGPQLGAQSIATEVGTLTATVTTDANGHASLGVINQINTDITVISILGMTMTSPDTSVSNTTPMPHLGMTWTTAEQPGNAFTGTPENAPGVPTFYLHNGPTNTAVTVQISICYLSKTVT